MLDRIPLEAFRVFDAAARSMNFSQAGRELRVTQAAVSRRIQSLEDHIGTRLFTRRGRNLALTPEGERLFQRVRATLEYLEESLEPFRAGSPQIVSISASGSVSHLWLARRLKEFARQQPAISVRLITTDSPAELAAETNDLVILYSTGEHPRWHLAQLCAEELAPVASPEYIARMGLDPPRVTADELAALDLVDYERFNAHWISYRQWFARIPRPPKRRPAAPRISFSAYFMAVEAALDGEGVALGSLGLVAEQIAAGTLVPLGEQVLRSGYGYYLGLPRYRTIQPEAMLLHQYLLASA